MNLKAFFNSLSPSQILVFWFFIAISVGFVLLLLPFATVNGISPVDSLFTATSATCVTGLIVVDTPTKFTFFGKIVILALIQAGGLGIMTISTFFMLIIGRRIGLRNRMLLRDNLNQNRIGGLLRLLLDVVKYTAVFEGLGIALFFFSFSKRFNYDQAFWLSIFHSISAFCNAGFSLFPNSFIYYKSDVYINSVLAFLIVSGGLGFAVLTEIDLRKKIKWESFSLQAKLVFTTTFILLFLGTILLRLGEAGYFSSIGIGNEGTKWLTSFFQSVTARTAGFNSVPIGSLATPALMILMLLMFVGGSPGSTAGGIKTVTAAVIFLYVKALIRGKREVTVFKRKIKDEVIGKSLAIVSLSLAFIFSIAFLLTFTEHSFPFKEIIFETMSAFGTVGLSMGITPHLSTLGKLFITITMFTGRLGPLTIFMAMYGKETRLLYKYPEEDISVG